MVGVFVDVRNAELRLPEERVIRTPKNLPLLGDRTDDRFERGTFVRVPERAGFDFAHDLGDSAPNRTEVLESLFPEKPRLVRAGWIAAPALDQRPQQRRR